MAFLLYVYVAWKMQISTSNELNSIVHKLTYLEKEFVDIKSDCTELHHKINNLERNHKSSLSFNETMNKMDIETDRKHPVNSDIFTDTTTTTTTTTINDTDLLRNLGAKKRKSNILFSDLDNTTTTTTTTLPDENQPEHHIMSLLTTIGNISSSMFTVDDEFYGDHNKSHASSQACVEELQEIGDNIKENRNSSSFLIPLKGSNEEKLEQETNEELEPESNEELEPESNEKLEPESNEELEPESNEELEPESNEELEQEQETNEKLEPECNRNNDDNENSFLDLEILKNDLLLKKSQELKDECIKLNVPLHILKKKNKKELVQLIIEEKFQK